VVWLCDEHYHQFQKLTTDGKWLQTISEKGARSDTGVPVDDFSSAAWKKVTHGGGPFNLPTDIAFAPDGSMFMTDGYGNARVHKFSPDASTSSPGVSGAGHRARSICRMVCGSTRRGRVIVADRENDRVQVFDQNGKLLTVWSTELIGPASSMSTMTPSFTSPEHRGGDPSTPHASREEVPRAGRFGARISVSRSKLVSQETLVLVHNSG
jgi:hypothetical protein